MSPISAEFESKAKENVKEIKIDNLELEHFVQKLERDQQISQIDDISRKCYDGFNDLQINLIGIKDQNIVKGLQLKCYETVNDLLAFIENDVDGETYELICAQSENFKTLIKHYNDYCFSIKVKYNLEGPEKEIRSNKTLLNKINSHLKRK